MVKDNRSQKNIDINSVQDGLAEVVNDATDGAYALFNADEADFLLSFDDRREPDYVITKVFGDGSDISKELFGIFEDGSSSINVYVNSSKAIRFQTPRNADIALRIAKAYEANYGLDTITLEDKPRDIF